MCQDTVLGTEYGPPALLEFRSPQHCKISFPYLTAKETEAEKLGNCPKASQWQKQTRLQVTNAI